MPLDVGASAPPFALRDQHRREVALADFADRHVLLVFYPWAFTGTCEGELTEIRDNLATYQNDTAQVLTVSVDSIFAHKVWAEREGFDFPLLADFWPHGAVAQAYGVFNERTGAANRGTFLVDPGGVIRFAEMNGPGEARDQAVWRKALAAV
ncbi:peroxiredoxin [Virgisporangium aliadipatigenens]|uniref:Alkyl hydroperoxide reductase E n=1 Tax=Virgisporangium aliadipatigenens TaxID=741659 RepID=A0A8J3YNA2_9ACTN|nr:peroxiredoxin [Virgisporangium aliadipatigenens]GIJ47010.1 peroxiredoxin [Virgisporangium aliadipatigenens]